VRARSSPRRTLGLLCALGLVPPEGARPRGHVLARCGGPFRSGRLPPLLWRSGRELRCRGGGSVV